MTTQSQQKRGRPRQEGQQQATIAQVLERAKGSRNGNGATPSGGQGVDWDQINQRLAQRLELASNWKLLDGLGRGEEHHETFGDTANGLAALISALRSEQTQGGDTQGIWLQLLDYINKRDQDALRDEVKEIREALSQPGGESFLDQLGKAAELGLVNVNGGGDNTLQTIQVFKELGLIQGGDNGNGHKSMAEQVKEMVELVNMLRPPQPQQPPASIQFSDGKMSIHDFLQIEEWKAKREDRAEEQRLQRERFEAGREALSHFFDAMGDAAAYLMGEEDPDLQAVARERRQNGRAERPARPSQGETRRVKENDTWTTVACDHCGGENYIDLVKRPPQFHCAACGELNEMEYGDAPAPREEAQPDAEDRNTETQAAGRPRRTLIAGAGV